MIVKRIYFPGSTYGQNKENFKKILTKYGLVWAKSAYQTHTSKDGKRLTSGIYYTPDQAHKILCIYEGDDKPAIFFYKTNGSGGNFLIDINSFCLGIGCEIDTKDEEYINNITLRLHDYGDINIPEDLKKEKKKDEEKDTGSTKLSDFKIRAIDLKIRMNVRKSLRRYIVNYGESLRRRGINIKVALRFKKRDVERDVMWALENGWAK